MLNSVLSESLARNQMDASTLRTEIFRKVIHMSVALVPLISSLIGRRPTLVLLGMGILFYTIAEVERHRGRSIPLITWATQAAARNAEDRSGIIIGPITLGLGALFSLLLYPKPAAAVAIYALAFGDGVSSLVGRTLGRVRLPIFRGKSLEGSLACFLVVFISSYRVMKSPVAAVLIAFIATILEAIPLRDMDNLLMPLGAGLVAYLFLV